MSKKGRWIPVTAVPSRDCQRCVHREGAGGGSVPLALPPMVMTSLPGL